MLIKREDIIHSDPEIMSGTMVFVGTRVKGGDTLEDFLVDFPSVSREQAEAALELARDSLVTRARPS